MVTAVHGRSQSRSPGEITGVLQTSRVGIGYLMEADRGDGRRKAGVRYRNSLSIDEKQQWKLLFDLIPAADFRHRSARRKYHQHRLDGRRSTTVRFTRFSATHGGALE
ncbi:hypothetical protein EVAR_62878_1 [Eumeta japonica]|uniref:Uncharacterized protein n=1 Tax=Eumeta variegata TaxID=151549 RepID=A0A4C1YZV0_EUMVA|nr:hypothetical protein EVAR_62878_1 [Eumeta japonica]